MGNRRPKPQRLAAKLLAIRNHRLSEYERGRREPNLMVRLRYAHVAGISVDLISQSDFCGKSRIKAVTYIYEAKP